jgi:hypothetical protein
MLNVYYDILLLQHYLTQNINCDFLPYKIVTLCPVTFSPFTQINTIACMVLYLFVYWLLLLREAFFPIYFWR